MLLMKAPGTEEDDNNVPHLEVDADAAPRMLGQNRNDTDAKAVQTRWNLQMYRDELNDECGGNIMIEERFLPLGVLAMMRRKAVRWNMVL